MGTPECKILVLGDRGVGKTNFLSKFKSGEFSKRYMCNRGPEEVDVAVRTTRGEVVVHFVVINCGDPNLFGQFWRDTTVGSDAAILMFDLRSNTTLWNIPGYHRAMRDACGDIPCVVFGNCVDEDSKGKKWPKLQRKRITFLRKNGFEYHDMSVKTGFNVDKPAIYLLRKLAHEPSLQLAYNSVALREVLPSFIASIQNADTAVDPKRLWALSVLCKNPGGWQLFWDKGESKKEEDDSLDPEELPTFDDYCDAKMEKWQEENRPRREKYDALVDLLPSNLGLSFNV